MRRREFVRNAGLASVASLLERRGIFAQDAAQALHGTLTIDERTVVATVPLDFMGLSYELAQLANPSFFARENEGLIGLVKDLGNHGVLRLGGGTSEFTTFTTEESSGPAPFDSVGPDTSKNIKADTAITPKSLRNLRAFLDATNWTCLYGLNLGRGSAPLAAEAAFHVQSILGPRLIGFQLGNEPDAWRNRYRPASWTYADYWKEWAAAYAAVLTRVPQAKFAGPDVSNKMAYVTGFAEDVKKSAPNVVMLTSHYYAMGPAGAKDVTLDKLLSPDPKLESNLKTAMDAAKGAGLPYRMCEGNSCWNGGQEGVSDTLASALWVVDMMLEFASGGSAGVNLHGGGDGFYTPIAGSVAKGFIRRPEYFGMLLARAFVGGTLVRSTLECGNDKVRAYAGRKAGFLLVLVVNKSAQAVEINVPMRSAGQQWLLSGPAIEAKQDVTVARTEATALQDGVLHVSPHSAVLIGV